MPCLVWLTILFGIFPPSQNINLSCNCNVDYREQDYYCFDTWSLTHDIPTTPSQKRFLFNRVNRKVQHYFRNKLKITLGESDKWASWYVPHSCLAFKFLLSDWDWTRKQKWPHPLVLLFQMCLAIYSGMHFAKVCVLNKICCLFCVIKTVVLKFITYKFCLWCHQIKALGNNNTFSDRSEKVTQWMCVHHQPQEHHHNILNQYIQWLVWCMLILWKHRKQNAFCAFILFLARLFVFCIMWLFCYRSYSIFSTIFAASLMNAGVIVSWYWFCWKLCYNQYNYKMWYNCRHGISSCYIWIRIQQNLMKFDRWVTPDANTIPSHKNCVLKQFLTRNVLKWWYFKPLPYQIRLKPRGFRKVQRIWIKHDS